MARDLLGAGYRRWLLAVLLLISTFSFIDRAVFTLLAEEVKHDLGLNDGQIGVLQGFGFAIPYLLFGIPFARLAERFNRIWIISIAVTIWSLLTVFCAWVANYAQLLFGRAGVGFGEAGFNPPASSLISDHFPPERRATAIAILWLGVPIGSLIGAVGGGVIAEALDWRTAFIVVGLPGILCALLALVTLKEPPRGLVDGMPPSKEEPPSFGVVLKHLFAKPTFIHILIGSSLAAFGMNGIGQFLAIFFIRVHQRSLIEAGLAYGVASAFSLSFGLLMGAFIAERLGTRDRRWWVWGPALGIVCSIPFYLLTFNTQSFIVSIVGITLANSFLFLYWSPTLAMVQNMSTPRMRATAAAVLGLMLGVMGTAAGPTAMGFISDFISQRIFTFGDFHAQCPGGQAIDAASAEMVAACRHAVATGLRYALSTTAIFFAWGMVHFLIATRTVARDVFAESSAARAQTAPAPAAGA